MEIKRDIYLNKLINKKHNGLITVVTGIRRCGKSYLLFNLFKDHLLAEGVDEEHIIEIAFMFLVLMLMYDKVPSKNLIDSQPLF